MTKYNGWDTEADRKEAYAKVDMTLGNTYQNALKRIIGGSNVPTSQKACLIAFKLVCFSQVICILTDVESDNPIDRAVAQKLALEMHNNGVLVVVTASLGPDFDCAKCVDPKVMEALQKGNSDGLDIKDKQKYDQLKNAPAAFIISNDSIADRGFRKLHATHNGAGNAFTSVHVGKVNRSFDAAKIAQIHNADLKPEEHPMSEKAAKAAIDNTLRADHWNDNLYAETDGTDKSNEEAVKLASKEVNQMVAERVARSSRLGTQVVRSSKLPQSVPRSRSYAPEYSRKHEPKRSAFENVVAMHSDLYSTSKNCQAEHNAAKQANIPMYTLHVGDPPHHRLPVDSGTPIRPYAVNQSDQAVMDIVSTVAEITANQTPAINDLATMLDREGAEIKQRELQSDVAEMKQVFGSTVDLPQPREPFIDSTAKQSVGIVFDRNTRQAAAKELQQEILARNPNADVQLHSIQSLAATYSRGGLPPVHGRSFILCENLRGSQHTVAENNMCSLYMSNQGANTSVCIGTKDQVFEATPDLLGVRAVDMEGASKVIQNAPSIGQPHLNLVSVGNVITEWEQKKAELLQDLQLSNLKEMTPFQFTKFAMKPLLGTGVLTAEEESICATTTDFNTLAIVFNEANERLYSVDADNPHHELVEIIDDTLIYSHDGAFETDEQVSTYTFLLYLTEPEFQRLLPSKKILCAMGLSGPALERLHKDNDADQNVAQETQTAQTKQIQQTQQIQQIQETQDNLTTGA
ncbi:hypothetical protein BDR26DRAFT_952232 [Obelidium mucronatum]|nr:hypothetical protein BDR26DRAFT_952232 [Obelidium mucronatum]